MSVFIINKTVDAGMAMCVKRMSSRSCLGCFSRLAIPTLMYI